jgi:hypothetical protein
MKCIFGNSICGKLAVARYKADIFNTPFEGGAGVIIHKKNSYITKHGENGKIRLFLTFIVTAKS